MKSKSFTNQIFKTRKTSIYYITTTTKIHLFSFQFKWKTSSWTDIHTHTHVKSTSLPPLFLYINFLFPWKCFLSLEIKEKIHPITVLISYTDFKCVRVHESLWINKCIYHNTQWGKTVACYVWHIHYLHPFHWKKIF